MSHFEKDLRQLFKKRRKETRYLLLQIRWEMKDNAGAVGMCGNVQMKANARQVKHTNPV